MAAVEVMGLTVWFSATAVSSSLQAEWAIDVLTAVWLTASVQLGFVVGGITSAVLTLGDRFPPHFVIGISAFAAGLATVALAVAANGLWPAIVLRFLTGMFLAGVYPIGMKVMSTWATSQQRGIAFGLLLGALTLGSGMPHLISGLGDQLPWRLVMLIAAGITLFAGFIAVMWIRPGEQGSGTTARPNIRYALLGFRTRAPLLANLGYFGHMWELYALWTWLPTYLLFSQKNLSNNANTIQVGLWSFISIGVAGLLGCLIGGWMADRFGRSIAAVTALAISGLCCLLSPFMFTVAGPTLLIFLIVWGASVIADSGVFSTALSESVDPNYVGTSLTAQTTIGYLITIVTIQLVPLAADLFEWQYAFLILLPGPMIGAVAMYLRGRDVSSGTTDHQPAGRTAGTKPRTLR